MKIFYSNEVGQTGTYWNMENGERKNILEQDFLNGKFIKAHPVIALSLAPVVGIVFAVFLPFIGLAMTAKFVSEKLYDGASRLAIQSYSMGWKPLESYLTGKKNKKK